MLFVSYFSPIKSYILHISTKIPSSSSNHLFFHALLTYLTTSELTILIRIHHFLWSCLPFLAPITLNMSVYYIFFLLVIRRKESFVLLYPDKLPMLVYLLCLCLMLQKLCIYYLFIYLFLFPFLFYSILLIPDKKIYLPY